MKTCPVGGELSHAFGWTDGRTERQAGMTKLIDACRNFPNALNNVEMPFLR
jgi:hypothetical protein